MPRTDDRARVELGWVEEWRRDPGTTQARKNWVPKVRKFIEGIPGPVTDLTRDLVEATLLTLSKSMESRNQIRVSLFHFIRFCERRGNLQGVIQRLLKTGHGSYRTHVLPASLGREVERVIAGHRTRRFGEPLTERVARKYRQDIEILYSVVKEEQPRRRIARLRDFRLADLDLLMDVLAKQGSRSCGRPLQPASRRVKIDHLLALFRAAKKVLGWPTDPMREFDRPYYVPPYRHKNLPQHLIDALRSVPVPEQATPWQRFRTARDNEMVDLCYELALRPGELGRLREEDVIWDDPVAGLIPVRVVGGKGRAKGHEDSLYLLPGPAARLRQYLDEKTRYERLIGVPHSPLLFVTDEGGPLAGDTWASKIWPAHRARAGVTVHATAYWLRHSRINRWLDDGLPIHEVSKLARHASVDFTLRYYVEFSRDSRARFLARRYLASPALAAVPTVAVVPEAVEAGDSAGRQRHPGGQIPGENGAEQVRPPFPDVIRVVVGADGRPRLVRVPVVPAVGAARFVNPRVARIGEDGGRNPLTQRLTIPPTPADGERWSPRLTRDYMSRRLRETRRWVDRQTPPPGTGGA